MEASVRRQSLGPLESTIIDVYLDTRRFTGQKTVCIFVTLAGEEYRSTAMLKVSANSRTDLVFNPEAGVDFNAVSQGQTPTQTIDVEYAGLLDWKITGIVEHSAPLEVKMSEIRREKRDQFYLVGYRLHITVSPEAEPGTFRWDMLLQTNDPASQLLPVLVQATIEAPLSVSPTTVSMGSIKVGQASSRKVLVRASKPFRIISVEGLDEGMTADLPTTSASMQLVTLKCLPTKPGDLKRQLTFKTDLDSANTASANIEGNAIP